MEKIRFWKGRCLLFLLDVELLSPQIQALYLKSGHSCFYRRGGAASPVKTKVSRHQAL
jgi:hypothetical protein